MSLVPIVYTHTDAGAPQLTGQVGSLVALLDAVLVNGYGTGVDAKPPAGWSLAFSGLNKRAYRNDPILFSGTYFRVDDSNAISGSNARAAYVRAFEQMTGIDSGVNGAPSVAQLESGDTWTKSIALSALARPWAVIATAKWFYLFIDVAGNGLAATSPQFAGDLTSYVPGDRYAFAVSNGMGGAAHAGGSATPSHFFYARGQSSTVPVAGQGAYLLRAANGAPGAVAAVTVVSRATVAGATNNAFGNVGETYPSAINGGLFAEEIFVKEGSYQIRATLPNCYAPLHNKPFPDMERLVGLSGFEGAEILAKTYRAQVHTNSGNDGQLLFDLTTPVA